MVKHLDPCGASCKLHVVPPAAWIMVSGRTLQTRTICLSLIKSTQSNNILKRSFKDTSSKCLARWIQDAKLDSYCRSSNYAKTSKGVCSWHDLHLAPADPKQRIQTLIQTTTPEQKTTKQNKVENLLKLLDTPFTVEKPEACRKVLLLWALLQFTLSSLTLPRQPDPARPWGARPDGPGPIMFHRGRSSPGESVFSGSVFSPSSWTDWALIFRPELGEWGLKIVPVRGRTETLDGWGKCFCIILRPWRPMLRHRAFELCSACGDVRAFKNRGRSVAK